MSIEFVTGQLEIKSLGADGMIEGYASVYGNVDRGNDIVASGAFDESIKATYDKGRKVKMLWQHDPSQPIGVWNEYESDQRGLKLRGTILTDIPKGAEAYALLKAGAVEGLSVGYRTLDHEYTKSPNGSIREIKKAELWETSVVTFPMNEEAGVTDVKRLQSVREVETLLRKAGVPGGFAKLVASYGYDEAINRLNRDSRDAGGVKADHEAIQSLVSNLTSLKETLNG